MLIRLGLVGNVRKPKSVKKKLKKVVGLEVQFNQSDILVNHESEQKSDFHIKKN